jgi:pimeloyl-ACP methyl ester carboxylesterase
MPTAETNGIETYYESHGEGDPIVLVHGGWADRRMWGAQVEALSESYRVITYDLRGHGETGPSAEPRYTVDLFAADLRALVEELSLARPVICGLSLGGMIAQSYAARSGELSALVLAGTPVSTRFTLRDRLQTLLVPKWSMTLSVRLLGPKRYANWAFRLARRLRGEAWFGRDEAVQEYVRETMAGFDAREFTKVVGAIYGFRGVDLAAIDVPTLVVNGEDESGSVLDHAAHMVRTIPDARSVVIPDAGHTVTMENPGAFTAELRTFLTATGPNGNE